MVKYRLERITINTTKLYYTSPKLYYNQFNSAGNRYSQNKIRGGSWIPINVNILDKNGVILATTNVNVDKSVVSLGNDFIIKLVNVGDRISDNEIESFINKDKNHICDMEMFMDTITRVVKNDNNLNNEELNNVRKFINMMGKSKRFSIMAHNYIKNHERHE